jgi:hypothetical protein
VAGDAARTSPLLQPCLVGMPSTARELVTQCPLGCDGDAVVDAFELLDHFVRPPTVEDVAADELPIEPVGKIVATSAPQELRGVTKEEVGAPDQLVKIEQPTAGSLHALECFGDMPDRRERIVVTARFGGLRFRHAFAVPNFL